MGFNTPVTLTGAITVTAPANQNLPWTSGTPNGWTQAMSLSASSGSWYPLNSIALSYSTGYNVLSWHNALSGTNWTEICFQSIEANPAYWVIFDKTTLYNKLYNMGFDWSSGSNGWYMVPFARSASINRNHTPSGKTCMLFSDIGIVESSGDYVLFTWNQQDKNPYIRVSTAPPNTPSDVLTASNPTKSGTPYIFQEDTGAAKNNHYPYNTDLGVFVR